MDPVIVVGAGPVGLALSLALAAQGVPSVVLDEGSGKEELRTARTAVLRPDTAELVERLGGDAVRDTVREQGAHWTGWRSMRRKQDIRHLTLGDDGDLPAPLHLPQHTLTNGLREAADEQKLVRIVTHSRLDTVEQDADGITAHTREPDATWWRGSFLVGCDGARSTVRKLLDIRFPGRTAVERHAVAALRTELPWPGEALLHRLPPWRTGGEEVTARPLPGDVWRLDWLLAPRGELVTPEALVTRVRDTLAGWCGETPPYELIDTGVYTLHHRLARRWRVGRAFLAGDAAHLLGALGTQGLDEGLRDIDNLAWKLARAWHLGASETLLDSYQAERRTAVAARLRAADQALPILRSGGGLRTYLPGSARGHDLLLTDGHLGRGSLGAPPEYTRSPLAPPHAEARTLVGTPLGAPVVDVRATATDGTTVRLRDRLGRGRLLVTLVAPGTGVWDRRHWMSAGVMPRLAAAVAALPVEAELLVAESYPGASAHTVLLVRPDGHLVTAFNGVQPAELYAAADAASGGAPATASAPPRADSPGRPDRTADIN
ncbi:MAG TPA: FAD-dependent monooxygenase [Streptomyces sp.]|nr:FAD-dependent monooxygenase [Streptomyces sp.]